MNYCDRFYDDLMNKMIEQREKDKAAVNLVFK